ncbi:uncharacterized protein LOC116004009 [Ipomoea triloba]|uniref:uncharacterized protein LOC116004009 n=1 Tax=Ipomoea triloba TaxID=35885 RepID=UPI00125D35E1|nr:uncharacterized protein LOC116004009 [Ipomoea triloba]
MSWPLSNSLGGQSASKVAVLPRLCSDHNPILFIDEAGSPPSRNLRLIRFEAASLTREDYKTIWEEATFGGDRPFEDIITKVTQKSMDWNRNMFGNIFNPKRHLDMRIYGIQCVNFSSSNGLKKLEIHVITKLNDVLDQEEAFLFQKSKMDLVREGDRNTVSTTTQL